MGHTRRSWQTRFRRDDKVCVVTLSFYHRPLLRNACGPQRLDRVGLKAFPAIESPETGLQQVRRSFNEDHEIEQRSKARVRREDSVYDYNVRLGRIVYHVFACSTRNWVIA